MVSSSCGHHLSLGVPHSIVLKLFRVGVIVAHCLPPWVNRRLYAEVSANGPMTSSLHCLTEI